MRSMSLSCVAMLSVSLLAAVPVRAALYLVDFDYSSANGGVAPAGGDWNVVSPFNLAIPPVAIAGDRTLTSTDGGSSLTLNNRTLSNAARSFRTTGPAAINGPAVDPAGHFPELATAGQAAWDGVWVIDNGSTAPPATFGFDITGFNPGDTINIALLAARYDTGGDAIDITVDGMLGTGTGTGVFADSSGFDFGKNGNASPNPDDPTHLLLWNGLAPADGTLSFNFTDLNRRVGVNALRIEVTPAQDTAPAVPEPATALLGGMALAILAVRRRA